MLIVLLYGLLQIPAVQTWVVGKVASSLSKKLNTKVSISSVNFRFFNQLIANGILIEDRAQDTLLYASSLKANVTDWFIFKDNIALKNIVLRDASINMKRSDSVWNYQFLIDYFSSPKTKGNKSNLDIDLEEVHLSNVKLNKIDGWLGQNMNASIRKMDLVTDSVNFNTGQLAIKSLYLLEPSFWQIDYDGNKGEIKDLTQLMNKIPIVSALRWNNSGFIFNMKNLTVVDGQFKNDKDRSTARQEGKFEGGHVEFTDINGNFKNVSFINDTLKGEIAVKGMERSGLEIKHLNASLKFTPEQMTFSNLLLETNKSKLQDYFSMQYKTFNEDFKSFLHNVVMEARFKGTNIHSDDLAFFGPALKSWKRNFKISGDAKGSVDNFTISALDVETGSSQIKGRLSMRGLPRIENTFIDFSADKFSTTYREMISVVPALKNVTTPALSKLGNIAYVGNFTGFTKDFVTYGTLTTNLGTLQTDINMKLPAGGTPAYSGKIKTNGFNLSSFLNNPDFGQIAVDAKIAGSGFSQSSIAASVKGDFNRLDFKGYSYQKIKLDGKFDKKVFEGELSINDPNLQISHLEGALKLSAKEPSFNLKAAIEKANLKKLGLLSQNLRFTGLVNLDFEGKNIDNFLGKARIFNATLYVDSSRLSFDSLALISRLSGNDKILSVQSNELDASIVGQYSIMDLPNSFKAFLSKYYPTYIPPPKRQVKNQNFSFTIKTNAIEPYLQIFEKRLSGFEDATISGKINTTSNELILDASVPKFGYDDKIFTNTVLQGIGNSDSLNAKMTVGNIKISDSLSLPGSRISLSAQNDLSVISVKTNGTKTLDEAELNASVKSFQDGIRIHFFPSSFVINEKKWLLEKDGEITLRKKYIDASEIVFKQNQQEISIYSQLDDVNDDTHLVAELRNLVIQDFTPFFVTKPSLGGTLTGTATIKDIFGRVNIHFEGIADSFNVDESYVGKVNLAANVNLETKLVSFKAAAAEPQYNFDVDGSYSFRDSISNRLNIDFAAKQFNIKLLKPFLKTVFSDMNGIAEGDLKIYSEDNNQYITGSTTINKGDLEIAFTKSRYLFDNQKITFGKNYIDLGTLQLTDTLGNPGTVQGRMNHHFFKDISFEGMRFSTEKMVLLNTTKADNEQFYGYVIGKAVMTMRGPVTNLQMDITGEPSDTDSSHIYLPTGESRENNAIDYIDFIQFGSEMAVDRNENQDANLSLNMNLIANPATKIDVILDEETGDVIKGQGNGRLNIQVGTTEPLRMTGRYDVTRGEYTFNFQTFLNRPFTINEGTITWNGDPLQAQIDLKAAYLAKNVDISSLSNSSNAGNNTTGVGQKTDITILANLTGSLQKPIINFDFKLPEYSELNRDYVVVNRLAAFKNDENQMLNQVASLLLFNSFINSDQSFLSQQNTLALGTNFVGGIISSWLTGLLNRELERATNGVISTYIDINPTLNLQAKATQLQANIRGGLKVLLSNRLVFYAGGNFDYNNQLAILSRRNNLTPDFTLEWLLNKDGTLRVIGFNKTSVDFTTGQRNRSGVQLSYRRDVNKLRDLFKSKKRVQEEDQEEQIRLEALRPEEVIQ